MKLVYSDATRGSCERSDYNVPMALTQNSASEWSRPSRSGPHGYHGEKDPREIRTRKKFD